MEVTKKNKENKTRYALLGILTNRECTGYEMKKIMESNLVYFWSESFGQIYPTLKQMEAEKLVQAKEQVVGQKTRYLYSITSKGRQVLRSWIAIPPVPEVIRNELLLKLFFAEAHDKDAVLTHLARQRLQDQNQLEMFEKIAEELRSNKESGQIFRALTLDYGLRALRAELDWLDHAERGITDLCM